MIRTKFRDSFIGGTSESFGGTGLDCGQYDVLILVSSWDERSVSVTSAVVIKAERAILLLFDLTDNLGIRARHDKILTEYCGGTSRSTYVIRGPSLDVELIWQRISSEIESVAKNVNRPLRIFIDISTCPRYYFGAVAALGMRFGLAGSITFFYAEGRYPEGEPDHEVTFTEGRWRSVPVPGMLGVYDPAKDRFFLVSVGFEGWKTLRVVSRADPDRVSLLFPDPGFEPPYPTRTYDDNKDLIEQYRIPEEHIVRAHAGDAIAAWKAISSPGLERSTKENVFYLCSGTKPHSLALILRAIVLDYPAVLYNLPDRHSIVPVKPNGRYWKYEIADVTSFPSTT